VQLLRPLLAWPKDDLIATCRAASQPFANDPSNESARFARTALRQRLAADEGERQSLRDLARRAGPVRAEREARLAALLSRIAEIRPDGAILLDRAGLADAPDDIRPAALAAVLRTAGGGAHPPEGKAVDRLDRSLRDGTFRGASLAGCSLRLRKGEAAAGSLLIVREAGRIAPSAAFPPGRWRRWDGRFLLWLDASAGPEHTVGPLGAPAFARLRRVIGARLPAAVAASLPALFEGERAVAAPGLGWAETHAPKLLQRFAPLWPLAPETFTVVYGEVRIICGRGGLEPAEDRRS